MLQWYRIILDDPSVELPLLGEPDLAQRAALSLAAAEEHLRHTLTTCDAYQASRDPLYEELENLDYYFKFDARIFGNYEFDNFIQGACQIIMSGVAKKIRQTQSAINKRVHCWSATGRRPCHSSALLSAPGARFATMSSL